MNYKIKSRIWIESENSAFLGEGRIYLLKAINETGSLSKAAKSIGISYKKAWQLLDSINKSGKRGVTINTVGGKGGGGSQLTDYGKSLIIAFDTINKNCWAFLDKELEKINKL